MKAKVLIAAFLLAACGASTAFADVALPGEPYRRLPRPGVEIPMREEQPKAKAEVTYLGMADDCPQIMLSVEFPNRGRYRFTIHELRQDGEEIVDAGGDIYEGFGPGSAGAQFLLPALRDGDAKKYRMDIDFFIYKREMTNFGEKQSQETYTQRIVYYIAAERSEDESVVRVSKESGKEAE